MTRVLLRLGLATALTAVARSFVLLDRCGPLFYVLFSLFCFCFHYH